jgi:uncharacterized protein (DUF362 family)
MSRAVVAAILTSPETVLEDHGRLMRLAGYQEALDPSVDTILKLNLSWTKFYPACSSSPYQVEGVIKTLIDDGTDPKRIIPVENKTVVTDPWEGAWENRWLPVLERYGLEFRALPEVEWETFRFESPLLKLNDIFPDGIEVPSMYIGRNVIHLPTVKTHGHSVTTGAIKNSFGGLLKELRHYAHEFMHEVLVDLLYMQKELHPGLFAVMDGTICGDGAGPRTMIPRVGNVILASSDQVAIDAMAAKLMGFDPLEIPYLRMSADRGLGTADPRQIELVGDDVSRLNLHFQTRKSLVIWGDQLIRKGPLRPLKRFLLHSPAMVWAPFASNLYHDHMWYPTVGARHIAEYMKTPWGELLQTYPLGPQPAKHEYTNTKKWQRHAAH